MKDLKGFPVFRGQETTAALVTRGSPIDPAVALKADQALGLARLRSFIGLANTLHFGRAARELHLTQSALSQRIAALERGLGVQLFRREARGVSLTPAGREFLKCTWDAVNRLEVAISATREDADERTEQMWITGAEAPVFVDAFVADVVAELGNLRLEPLVTSYREQVSTLHSNDGYVTILNLPYCPTVSKNIRVTVIGGMPSALVTRPGHPLAGKEPVSISDAAGLKLWNPPPVNRPGHCDSWLRSGQPLHLDVAPAYWAAEADSLVDELSTHADAVIAPMSLAARVPAGQFSFTPLSDGPSALTALAWPMWVSACEVRQLTSIARAVWRRIHQPETRDRPASTDRADELIFKLP